MKKNQIQVMLMRYLKGKGYTNIKSTNMYLIAEGTLPVCLCAHMDTVFSVPPKDFYFDKERTTLWSPDGLGTDDRAGIYAIIMLIEKGYRPSLVFTDLEERGGQGASALVEKYPDCPFPNCRALIQLDRQGAKDAVFYECDNNDFTQLVLSYGFDEEWGTFTDISILAPTWEVAAVNLSVGYYNEHSHAEMFNIKECHQTIDKVEKMLQDCENWASYAYIPAPKKYYSVTNDPNAWWNTNKCCFCGKHLEDKEGAVVEGMDGKPETAMLLCDSCFEQYSKYLT